MIAKMKSIKIYGQVERLDDCIAKCFESGCFHPELAPRAEVSSKGTNLMEKNPYTEILGRLMDVSRTAEIEPRFESEEESEFSIDSVKKFTEEFENRINDLVAKRRSLLEDQNERKNVLTQLEHIEGLNIDLDELFQSDILKIRFGRLPVDSYPKLDYYDDKLFIFVVLDRDPEYYWGVYFSVEGYDSEVDAIFSSLYYERIRVPNFIHGTPEDARAVINSELEEIKDSLIELDEKQKSLIENSAVQIGRYYTKLKRLNDIFEMRKYASVLNNVFFLSGYVPAGCCKKFMGGFDSLEGIQIEEFIPERDKDCSAPTKLKNNWFIRPFEMFVDMYGLPAYNDIDPTPFFSYTYLLLFGLMFGDLGQGLVISLIGYLMYRLKKMQLGQVMVRLGLSSAVFGLFFGSVFGFETALDPFYRGVLGLGSKPFEIMAGENVNIIIAGAIVLGALIILISMILNVVVGFKKRDYGRALFGNNGIAGLIFYGYLLTGAASMMLGGPDLFTTPFLMGCVLLPLMVIFLKGPFSHLLQKSVHSGLEEGVGSFIVEGFFELFEVVLSFITNTMSFLRVGGFVLSHAGMMMVVMTLSDMVGASGSIAVVIIGNIFVIAMEGLVVGIQALRLEFYEMFSRYFDGDGVPFQPVGITQNAQNR